MSGFSAAAKAAAALAAKDKSKHPHGAGGKFASTGGAGGALAKSTPSGQGKTTGIKGDDVIFLHVTENAKKAGSKSHERFSLLKTGMTVGEYLEAAVKAGHDKKTALADVAYDLKKGYTSVVDGAVAKAAVKAAGGDVEKGLSAALHGKVAAGDGKKVASVPKKGEEPPAKKSEVEKPKPTLKEAQAKVAEHAASGKKIKIGDQEHDGNSVVSVLHPHALAKDVGPAPAKTGPVHLAEHDGKSAGTVDRSAKLTFEGAAAGMELGSKKAKKFHQAGQRFKEGQTVQEFFDGYPGGEAAAAPVLAHYKNWGVVKVTEPAVAAPKKTSISLGDVAKAHAASAAEVEAKKGQGFVNAPTHWLTATPESWKDDPERWAKVVAPSLVPHNKPQGKAQVEASADRAGLPYVSAEQNSDVASYTGSGYLQINSQLRSGAADVSKGVFKRLDDLTRSSEFKEDTIMYRGVGTEGGINDLPPPGFFDDKGFVSLSFNPILSAGFAGKGTDPNASKYKTLLRVRVPKGANGVHIARGSDSRIEALGDEAEVLLPHGAKFVVVGRSKQTIRRGGEDREIDVIDVEHLPH